MKKSRLFLTLLGFVCLLLLIASSVPLIKSLEMDPPSVYNSGYGGLERYAVDLMFNQRIEIIFKFDELQRFKPEEFSLLIVGPDEQLQNIEKFIEWISGGGIAIVLDELNYTAPLFIRLGLSRGDVFNIIDLADCDFNGVQTKILVNVFSGIMSHNTDNVRSVCRYHDVPVGVYVEYGRGMLVFIGDSSLVINDVYLKSPQWYRVNAEFIRLLSMGRNIVIYEGSRRYSKITSEFIASIVSTINNEIPAILKMAIDSSLMNRFICMVVLLTISVLYTIYKFGLPRYRIDENITFKYAETVDYHDFKEKVRKGMISWVKSIEDQSKSM